MQPTAQIITIGDELLLGQVVDTNSAFIGATAADAGLRMVEILSVSDKVEAIRRAIDEAIKRVDVVIITGGLGPTKDDITKRTIADYFGVDLVRDEQTYTFVRDMLTARGVEFNTLNEAQADIPRGFSALANPVGTAPGLYYNHAGRLIFCLPGVPFEMKKLFTEQVLPIIDNHFSLKRVVKRTVLTYGLPESELAALIAGWENSLPNYITLAYLPNPRGIRLRLTAHTEISTEEIDRQFATLQSIIPDYYLGDDPTSVEELLSELLLTRGETLSVAESCTGGAISARCTAIAGASAWYQGSVTSYSNQVKASILGVDPQSIERHGAVSSEVVAQMADGVRRATGSTYAVATSGIAGPSGGSDEKPVGAVWIGIASDKGTQTYLRNFGQPRDVFIERASTAALNYLRLGIAKGLLILILMLAIPSALAQQIPKRSLGELLERMVEVNYSKQIGELRVEQAKANHTPAPFLPSLEAQAVQSQQFGDAQVDNLSVGAKFNWRLFDGIGMFHNYAITKENYSVEQIVLSQQIEDLVDDVSSQYYNIIAIDNQVSVLQNSLQLSRERYNQASSKYTIGAGSGLEMRLAGADVNADSSNLIKARQSLDLAYIELNNYLRYPTTERGYIRDSIIFSELPNADTLRQRTISNNSDIILASKGIRIRDLEVKSAQAARYPTLDFSAAYNYGMISSQPASSFSSSNGGSWGFTIGANIFNGMETSRKIKSAKFESTIAQIELSDVTNKVISQLETEIILYTNALTLAELERQNSEAMELNMTLAMERYRLGDLSGIDFRNIQLQYLSALERKISTEYAVKIAQINILNLSGDLFP